MTDRHNIFTGRIDLSGGEGDDLLEGGAARDRLFGFGGV